MNEFKKIILMPDDYIIYRAKYELNGAADWWSAYSKLNAKQKEKFHTRAFKNDFNNGKPNNEPVIDTLFKHYKKRKRGRCVTLL